VTQAPIAISDRAVRVLIALVEDEGLRLALEANFLPEKQVTTRKRVNAMAKKSGKGGKKC
jgi:hypothetical protein